MHLKSLTLKGFKSFASATTLRFEPGITCVVGPNGSGKSNVVDAIAWVLGEQGAKTLRGGKMEDVIFAGTAGRPALGRAEVTLTIDNADGALPIEYTEVSITRRMYRSGESEYEINRSACRLLDVQELLSDSGIGREMHVIVGQGKLDSVLSARPEDRRAFIEEAAGVLKHRKRKEKALRKLDAMQANLTRLTDLTAELRRQLKPLGRQAEVARRAATVQADLRDARLRLLADDLVQLRFALDREVADETAVRERRGTVERELAAAQDSEAALEQALTAGATALARAQETWYRLSALEERIRGTGRLAAERARFLTEVQEDPRPGRDPDLLDREAEETQAQERDLHGSLDLDQRRLLDAVQHRQALEGRLAAAERALVAATRAAADHREGLVRLAGQVNALGTRAEAGADEIARLSATLADARARAHSAQADFDRLQSEVGALDDSELGLDERHEAAVAALQAAQARVRELVEAEQEADRQRSSWTARRDALVLGLSRKDGTGVLLAAAGRLPGLLGSVAALLVVRPGHEAALAAALGTLADAIAVSSPADAAAALTLLKESDGGRAGLMVAGGTAAAPASPVEQLPALPPAALWAIDVVDAPAALRPALHRALGGVALVADLPAARSLVEAYPSVRAVTPEGDLIGADWAVGGSASAPSTLEVQAAVDEAQAELDAALRRQQANTATLGAARAEVAEREVAVHRELEALHQSDAEHAAVAERLGHLGSSVRAAVGEAERVEQARRAAEQARDRDLAGLADLEERLHAAESAPADGEPSADERDVLAGEVATARQGEMEVRLAVRTAEERVRALAGRTETLRRAASDERAARERADRTRLSRARGAVVSAAVMRGAQAALARLSLSLEQAAAERDAAQQARVVREGELLAVRHNARELAAELERLTDVVHRDEVARAEQRMRIEALESRAAEDHGVGVDTLIAEYGPHATVPGPAVEGEPAPEPAPYDRATQEKRAARAERDLALLGRVNPLALEEFSALEERHAFLSTQLEDLRDTRRDLLTVVREVDDRIHDVFAAAFADTAREFEIVFGTLFPGGEGRLLLTDPDDLMVTGVEVEARPPGKKIKRLSLLSGGERSLTAIALLVAIFRARPSPFYVLDEVEAALDDVNLGRLIGLIDELKQASQLIVVTHQKRTMEVADALYGATMRGDGITTLISQRLRELETA
ncbi:MAG: chromosome segregation protein SMC [Pseudonocardiales bacterium]|nr:MAG: chromosome segregation protein SMC [Pseudonocardiales bacterium]